MPISFPSDEWIKALMAELNKSDAYRAAAANWEGDFAFVISPGPGVPNGATLYTDLWHGECRKAFMVSEATPLAQPAEFAIEAPLATWRKVLEKKLDPIMGLMTRQLKLTGNLAKVMKAPKAAVELVHCCTLIETEWPGG
jgi:putative sterol carrier protein